MFRRPLSTGQGPGQSHPPHPLRSTPPNYVISSFSRAVVVVSVVVVVVAVDVDVVAVRVVTVVVAFINGPGTAEGPSRT